MPKLYGGEFGFHLHPHPLDWLHFETNFETVTGKQDNNSYLPLIPANSLNNFIRFEFENNAIKQGHGFFGLKTVFNQNNFSEFETKTAGYNLVSAGLGGTMSLFNNELNISIAGNNLFNKKYISHLSRLKPDGIFNIGRNFSLGLTYNL